jgi:Glycosyl transferase family 11
MIISFILGGLGNQFFQYAVGRQLACLQSVAFKIERRGYAFPKYAHHPYLLDKFNIKADPARAIDYVALAAQAFRGSILTFERTDGFNGKVLQIRHGTVLVGYWQSARYFSGIADVIREELTLKEPPSVRTRELVAHIGATDAAVSVHVRRADYLTPKSMTMFEQCSLDYYREAIQLVARSVGSPHFFVFSDDHAWTRANLQTEFPTTYVEHNDGFKAYEDVTLMRACRHHIIANSTFSWWGAWLNPNANKIVVAPRRWFKDDRYNLDDLLPPEWVRL